MPSPPLRSALPHMLAVLAVTLALYAVTAPRTVALEDDGDFVMAAYYLGVPHPPGYPLYVLLAKPFTWLPVGSVAYRVHLASAFFGAATCAVLWWVARALALGIGASYLAALAYGFSGVFWSQAIIADVYTLNTFLFFTLLALCLAYRDSRRGGLLSAIVLLYGIGLTNHWPLLMVATPCLVLVLATAGRALARDARARGLRLGLLLVLGLLPYAWLVQRSRSAPELAFYGAIDTWHDLWFYVSRGGYTWARDESSPASAWDTLRFVGFLLGEGLRQFTPLGALCALAGAALQWRRWGVLTSAALVLGFAGSTIPLLALLSGEYDFVTQAVVHVFPLVSYGVMALWLGLAFDTAAGYLAGYGRRWSLLAHAAGTVLLAALCALNLRVNDRRGYTFARDYAVTLLDSFPPGAVVFTAGDVDTLALGYFHFVEGVRPDVRLRCVYGIGMGLDGRMFDPIKLSWQQKMDVLTSFAAGSDAPVYFFHHAPPTLSDENLGFYRKVDRSTKGRTTFRVNRDLMRLFRRIEGDSEQTDPFTVMQRELVIAQVAGVLTPLIHLGHDPAYAEYRADLERASQHFSGLLERIRAIEQYGGASDAEVLAWIEKTEGLDTSTVRRTSHASLYTMKGRVLRKLARTEEAIAALKRSVALYHSSRNPAWKELEALGATPPSR